MIPQSTIPVAGSEANQVLRDEHVDTVVWDIRLENDNDDKDVSGLEASHKTPPGVGKVITTNFAVDVATGREFRDMIPTHSPFVSYVDKHAGIPAILAAAKEVTAFSLISRNGAALWDLVSASQSASSRQTQTWLVVVLLLALGFGVTAALTGYVGWLFLTVALAIFAVVLIGKID